MVMMHAVCLHLGSGRKVIASNLITQIFFDYQENILYLQGNTAKQQNIIPPNTQNHQMANTETLDVTDIRILRALQQNARLTVKELAERVHLSPSPTFERQKRLEREGYIQRYVAVTDHHKLGNHVIVLCNIRLKQHTHELIQQFMDTVQTIDQITECYNTSGDFDFQIKVYARDMKAYQDFMLNTLGNIDCIGSLHSVFVIGEIKDSHVIPVAPPAP